MAPWIFFLTTSLATAEAHLAGGQTEGFRRYERFRTSMRPKQRMTPPRQFLKVARSRLRS